MTKLEDQISALKLFNEKAEELLELSFIKALSTPNSGFTISQQKRDDGQYKLHSEIRGPSKEATKAFVLTFRYFIQNNETISLKNIADLYDQANIDTNLKDQFNSARDAANNMLDSPNFLNLKYNNSTPTNREVMNVFIYGGLAHANPQKYQLYKDWMSSPPIAVMLQACFNLILRNVLKAIVYVSQANEKALEQLERQK